MACGGADAYYEYGMHVWDMAAATLIASEAGCTVSDPNGDALDLLKRRILVASSGELSRQLGAILKPVVYESD